MPAASHVCRGVSWVFMGPSFQGEEKQDPRSSHPEQGRRRIKALSSRLALLCLEQDGIGRLRSSSLPDKTQMPRASQHRRAPALRNMM